MNLLQTSISSGVLILFILCIRFFTLNRLPKRTFIILWGIATLRCLLPFSLPIPSLLSVPKIRFSSWPNHAEPSMGGIPSGALTPSPSAVSSAGVHVPLLLFSFWIAGLIVFSLFFLVSFYRMHRQLRTALPLGNHAFVDQWLREQPLRRPLRILVSDQIQSPLTYGLFHPKILLPKGMDFSQQELLSYILTHELVHIKRLDGLWKLVSMIALCIHWFNPLVWALHIFLNRDLEIFCDEKVVRLCGSSRDIQKTYALSLLHMAEQASSFVPFANSFSKNTTKERIVSIMKLKKATLPGIILAVLLIAGVTTACAASIPSSGTSTALVNTDGSVVNSQDENAPFHSEPQNADKLTFEQVKQFGVPYTAEESRRALQEELNSKVEKGRLSQEEAARCLADAEETFLKELEEGRVKAYVLTLPNGNIIAGTETPTIVF